MTATNKNTLAACSILSLLVWAVFGNGLGNGFVWDDAVFTVNNPVYRDFDIVRIFTTLANGVEYLPVTDVSYAVDYALGYGQPAVFHLSNLCFYTFTVLSVFFYAQAAYRSIQPEDAAETGRKAFSVGFITALLFAVHPIHCEVVDFITCKNALLSTLFFFAAAIMFLQTAADRNPGSGRIFTYLAAVLLFLLSVFSKANSIILPLILVLHVLFLNRSRWLRLTGLTLPFFAIAAGSFFLMTAIATRVNFIADKMADWTLNGCITKAVKAVQITHFYFWKLVFPRGLSVEYEPDFAWSLAAPAVIAIIIGLLVLSALAFRLRKTTPYILFGLCWYLLSLVPVLNFFATTPVVADRYAFLPSFAFFFVVACAGVQAAEKIGPKIPIAIGIILVTCWGTSAALHNRIWFSDETLWADTIKSSPKNIRGYRNLGTVYLLRGDYDRALTYFAPIKDDDPCYHYVLGYLAFLKGDLTVAQQNLVKSLGRDVNYIGSLYYLGMVYKTLGERATAVELFNRALLSHDPAGGAVRAQAAEQLRQLE